jgi:hypothetical protein
MDLAELERRMTRIEDREAIKELKARYCAVCDDDHNPDSITTLFVEDGIWEGGDFGKAQGHAAIRQLFQTFQQLIRFSQLGTVQRLSGISLAPSRFARRMKPNG